MADTSSDVLLSHLTRSLHGKRVRVNQNKLNEFLTGYTVLHRRLHRSLGRSLRSITDYEARRANEGWSDSSAGSVDEPLDDFLEASYAAAELFELYETDIPKLFKTNAKAQSTYRGSIRKLKRETCLICNRCKHNHAFMQAIEAKADGTDWIAGFIVLRMNGDKAEISQEIHERTEAFSYNWALRRLLGNVLVADTAASNLIRHLPDEGSPASSISFTLPYSDTLLQIAARPHDAMPKERLFPDVQVDDASKVFDIVYNEGCRSDTDARVVRAFLDLVSHRLDVELPYLEGTATLSTTNQSSPGQPIPAYLRAVITAKKDD